MRACSRVHTNRIRREFVTAGQLVPPYGIWRHRARCLHMNNQPQPTNLSVPTVSRVCTDQTLIELVYDAAKRTTGLAVSRFGGLWNIEQEVRIETGETLVPYSPKNNLIFNECVLLPS